MASSCYAVSMDLLNQKRFEVKVGPGHPRFVTDNDLVGFEKESEEVYFHGTSRVTYVEEKVSGEIRFRIVEVDELTNFSKPRRLSVLAGSLEKVYRFLEPERHFRRCIVALPKSDFATIVEERVDVYRTVFRYLFSALPLEIQTEFIRTNTSILPSKPGRKIRNYSELAPRIVSFFEGQVGETLSLLARIPTAYRKIHVDDLPSLKKLYMASEDAKETVAFGEITTDAEKLLKSNPIFASETDSKPLLQECKNQLSKILISESVHIWKKWNENLF